jgi:hypothetical protein
MELLLVGEDTTMCVEDHSCGSAGPGILHWVVHVASNSSEPLGHFAG